MTTEQLLDAVFMEEPVYKRGYASHVARWSVWIVAQALDRFYADPIFRNAYRARGGKFNPEYGK